MAKKPGVMSCEKRIAHFIERRNLCQKEILDPAASKVKQDDLNNEYKVNYVMALQLRELITTNLLLSRLLAKIDPDGPDIENTAGRLFRDEESNT
jgi:hypothetical protein